MNIVPTIKIAGVRYLVQLVPQLRFEEECSGKAIHGRAIIKIDKDLCPDMMNATQIHEVFEIIDAENELKIPHHVLQCLATQWYQVIVDNPEMFK